MHISASSYMKFWLNISILFYLFIYLFAGKSSFIRGQCLSQIDGKRQAQTQYQAGACGDDG